MFMRVKVALPISKPLRRGAFVAGSNGQRKWVSFRYERLALFCHHCGLLGHDIKHCAQHFAITKGGREVPCQYGEWLKASGSRGRSPNRRDQVREADDKGNAERRTMQQHQNELSGMVNDGGRDESVIRDGEDMRFNEANMNQGSGPEASLAYPMNQAVQSTDKDVMEKNTLDGLVRPDLDGLKASDGLIDESGKNKSQGVEKQ